MSHNHHHCDGSHDHDETPEKGIEYSLYEKIDKDNMECLNEAQDGSAKRIFKPWEERLTFDVVNIQIVHELILALFLVFFFSVR